MNARVICFLLLLPNLSIAADRLPESSAPKDTTLSIEQKLDAALAFQDAVLSTVYWSLGLTATLAVLLVGFGWFSNFRIYDRDRASLSNDLDARFKNSMDALKNDIDQRLLESFQANDAQITERIPQELRNLTKVIDAKFDVEISTLKRSISRQSRLLKELEFVQLKTDRKEWLSRNVIINAATSSGRLILKAIELEDEYQIANSLDYLRSDLESLIQPGNQRLEAIDIREMEVAISKVEAEHQTTVTSIRALLIQVGSNT